MKKEEIEPWDWERILLGNAPAEFMVEVALRTVFMYLLLLVVLRLLGKRMDGQLTLTELAVMITFGAIISVPMQIPDRGLLIGIVALVCVLIFQRGLNWLAVKNERVDEISQGRHAILVKDGIMQLDQMQKAAISKQHLFAALRQKMIYNLGSVKRVYFEACGLMNIYPNSHNRPGLSVLPSDEKEVMQTQIHVLGDKQACRNCGNVTGTDQSRKPCHVCNATDWMEAVV